MDKLHPYLKQIFVPGNLIVDCLTKDRWWFVLSEIDENPSWRFPGDAEFSVRIMDSMSKQILDYIFYSSSALATNPARFVKLATRTPEKPRE